MSRRPRDLRPVFLERIEGAPDRETIRRLAERLRAAILADPPAASGGGGGAPADPAAPAAEAADAEGAEGAPPPPCERPPSAELAVERAERLWHAGAPEAPQRADTAVRQGSRPVRRR